ncbi:galactose oxidase [Rhizophagus irregularis]|nr:galactose oxidase [Rhizophagus irregularis]
MIFLNNSLIYVIFGILLQLLLVVKVYSQILTIKPDLRYDHTATLIRDGLYIIGGATPDGKTPNYPFLFLDVSIPFDTKQLKWHDLSNLSNNDIVPSHQFAAAIKGGADNNTLFLYGGMNLDNNPMSLVYTLNNLSWDTPKINGTPPNGKLFITPVIDYNGLIYLFGGYSTENIYTNDMFILDSINLSWKNVSSINAPSPRIEYSAVFLPNKKIIYIGGQFNNTTLPLSEVYLYDTVNDIWTTQMTGGSIPSARFAFSSVLGLDGQRIIIFGGMNSTHIISEALYVLDLNNYNWYIPSFFEQQLNARAEHKTVLIDKYMVITFGQGYTRDDSDSDILLLDISNNDQYAWTTSFDPTPTIIHSSNIGVVIGVVFGSTFVAISLLIGSYYLRKWYKNKKEQTDTITTPEEEHPREILRIPGEKNTQDQNQQPTSTSQILQISGNTSNSLQNNEMIQEVRDENKGIPTSGEDHREDHP